MYNGIGLQTPRGTGTSGHVTKNLSSKRKLDSYKVPETNPETARVVSKEILDHNRKREIEAKLFEMEESMIEQGYSDEEIQLALADKRNVLLVESRRDDKAIKTSCTDSHEVTAAKEIQNEKFRKAARLSGSYS
jgi:serine/arginine repetitive matrix protein 2